jgi:hypothetical protein
MKHIAESLSNSNKATRLSPLCFLELVEQKRIWLNSCLYSFIKLVVKW